MSHALTTVEFSHVLKLCQKAVFCSSEVKTVLIYKKHLHFHSFYVLPAEMRAVRLTGGLDRCSGRVEIHRNGSWGTVCDNCWNKKLASMVCSMLQCSTEASKVSQFVPPLLHKNNGTQWFYTCYGNEQNLWECKEKSNKPHLCKDSKASGVICNGEKCKFYSHNCQSIPE